MFVPKNDDIYLKTISFCFCNYEKKNECRK